jgi:hypothetical protein
VVRLLLAVIVAAASTPAAADPVAADPVGWRHDEVGVAPIVVTWDEGGADVAPTVGVVWERAVVPPAPAVVIEAGERPAPAAPPVAAILPFAPKTSPPR